MSPRASCDVADLAALAGQKMAQSWTQEDLDRLDTLVAGLLGRTLREQDLPTSALRWPSNRPS